MRYKLLQVSLLLPLLLLLTVRAQATLTTDLQTLVTDLNGLSSQLATFQFNGEGSCAELGTLNTSIEDHIATIENITAGLASPLSLTTDDMTSLDDLSYLARNMADDTVRLSWDLRNLEDVQELFQYRAALSAMLRLSDDIGTMANRILEMADRILIMADNIGSMADRILITQQLQNSNIALTQAATLTTLNNMVALSDSFNSIAYNLTLGQLNGDTQDLLNEMANVGLTETNMAGELAQIESSTTFVLNKTLSLYTTMMLTSQGASHYINGDTLTLLGDLSDIHQALAASLEAYAQSIELLSPVTDNVILRDATASMLRLAKDIGIMSDRIMEMTDNIIVMADNIGLMAERIVETQNIQQTNVTLTEGSILAAQSIVINAISTQGL